MSVVQVFRRGVLLDNRVLWAVRHAAYGRASRPDWLVLIESVEGERRRLHPVDGSARPVGAGTVFTPTANVEELSARWFGKPVEMTDAARIAAVRELARRHRLDTQIFAQRVFDNVVQADDAERRRRVVVARVWTVIERHDLFGDGVAALLALPTEQGTNGRHQVVVRVVGDRAEALEADRDHRRGELRHYSQALTGAADDLRRGLAGDAAALTAGLARLDDTSFLLAPHEARRAWDLLVRQDETARLKAEGRLTSLADARRAAQAQPQAAQARIAKRQEKNGIVAVTLMLPADREQEFRRLADQACQERRDRIKRETQPPAVIPLAPAALPDPDDPMAVARRREAVIAPLAAQERLGRPVVAAAAAEIGVSVQRMYGLIAEYRAAPATETLVPSKGGRPVGLKVIDETVERIIAEYSRSALTAAEPPSMRALVKQIRERCAAEGLRLPDKDTIRARHEEQRRRLEEERVVVHSEALSNLARISRLGWTRGISGDVLEFAGTRIEIRKDLERGGYVPVIDGDRKFRREKADTAKRDALFAALRQQIEAAAGHERAPWDAPPALIDAWAEAFCEASRSRWSSAASRDFIVHLGDRGLTMEADGDDWRVEVSGPWHDRQRTYTATHPTKEPAVREAMRLALTSFFKADARRRTERAAEQPEPA